MLTGITDIDNIIYEYLYQINCAIVSKMIRKDINNYKKYIKNKKINNYSYYKAKQIQIKCYEGKKYVRCKRIYPTNVGFFMGIPLHLHGVGMGVAIQMIGNIDRSFNAIIPRSNRDGVRYLQIPKYDTLKKSSVRYCSACQGKIYYTEPHTIIDDKNCKYDRNVFCSSCYAKLNLW